MSKDTIYVAAQTVHDWAWWMTVITPLLSAAIAVVVGWILQRQQKKREQKQNVFNSIVGERHLGDNSATFAMYINQIPIVFHKNKLVVEKYKQYVEKYSANKHDEAIWKPILSTLIRFMANDLGYVLDENVFETSFLPFLQEQQILSDRQSHTASLVRDKQSLMDLRDQSSLKKKKDNKHL